MHLGPPARARTDRASMGLKGAVCSALRARVSAASSSSVCGRVESRFGGSVIVVVGCKDRFAVTCWRTAFLWGRAEHQSARCQAPGSAEKSHVIFAKHPGTRRAAIDRWRIAARVCNGGFYRSSGAKRGAIYKRCGTFGAGLTLRRL